MVHEPINELDARAVRASVDVVSRVTPADLARSTPCAGWNLGELLAHMIAQHRGFAASAHGGAAGLTDWQPGPAPADPAREYKAAADEVLAAFAEDGVLTRAFALPEILPDVTFPGRQAIGFHLVDYTVHGWDVARALGVDLDLDQAVLDASRQIAAIVPGGDYRTQPGAAFAPAVAAPPGASILDEIVAILGRAPTWPN